MPLVGRRPTVAAAVRGGRAGDVSVIVVLSLVGYLLADLDGAVVAWAAAVVGLRQPRLVAFFGLAVLVLAGLATIVEGRLGADVTSVGRFVRDRPWAAELGRTAGLLLLVAVVTAAVGERGAPLDAVGAHRRRRGRGDAEERVGVAPVAVGLAVAGVALATVGDRRLWLLAPLAWAAAAALVWSGSRSSGDGGRRPKHGVSRGTS